MYCTIWHEQTNICHKSIKEKSGFEFMGFNATFNNISVILWWSFLLVEETGIPEENH
jgi:hypothetical protein